MDRIQIFFQLKKFNDKGTSLLIFVRKQMKTEVPFSYTHIEIKAKKNKPHLQFKG